MSADRITNLREVVLSQNGATILIGEDENNPSIAFVLQDSPYRLVIDNDEIDIYENDKIISRWKDGNFCEHVCGRIVEMKAAVMGLL